MNILRALLSRKFRISYSQLGEDIVIAGLLRTDQPITYVDVGANHPMYGNNSFYFYLRGGRGICADPNSKFIPQF